MSITFWQDVKRGKKGEQLVCRTFAAMGYEIKDTTEDESFFKEDVDLVTADGIKYEIKTDYRFASTGNFAIEESYTDEGGTHKGWLYKSKADYFIFVDANDDSKFYSIAADDLRHLVKTEYLRRVTKDEYYKFIDLVLLPLGRYESCFETIYTDL